MNHASETTFDILGYLRRLGRHALVSALVGLLVAVGAFFWQHRTPSSYTAMSTLIFQPAKVTTEAEATQQGSNVQAQMRNYRQLVSTDAYLRPLATTLGDKPNVDALRTTLVPVWVPGSLLMTFAYTTTSEQQAITVANAAAEVFQQQMAGWTAGQEKAMGVQVTKSIPAAAPVTVTSPSIVKQGLMSLVAGAFVALLVAMVLDAVAGRRGRQPALPADAA